LSTYALISHSTHPAHATTAVAGAKRRITAAHARQAARDWIEASLGQWPGLRAAHLVGGITTMPDDAPFPAHKDVDVHLIFDEGSPLPPSASPWMNILEVSFDGFSIEAGVKTVAEYRSAESVLANPEIAHHLTVDSVLYDPSGLLRDLRGTVRWEYRRKKWVLARIDHERSGFARALDFRAPAADAHGASGEVNILGYSTTFIAAMLWVATLNPPRMGSGVFLRLRELLTFLDRLDLYEDVLATVGIGQFGPERATHLLEEATEGFDLAIAVGKTPGPFQHKLQGHLRPYFVDSCRSMLEHGHHREALGWVLPYHLATTDVIMAEGPESERPRFAERQARLLAELGLDTAGARASRFEQAGRLFARALAFAHEIVDGHPDVLD
jgi:hypothetical protein